MKSQMKFQKNLCLTLLILGALSVVYGLAYCTGVLAGFGSTLLVSGSRGYYAHPNFESGGNLFLEVQSINNIIFYLGIVMLLAAVVLYITGCNTRRNYYVSNYVASIAVAAVIIIISVVLMILNGIYLGKTLDVLNDADAMANYLAIASDVANKGVVNYSENISMFIIGFVLYIIDIIGAVLLILNAVWKNKLMKGEKALLEQGAVKEVA